MFRPITHGEDLLLFLCSQCMGAGLRTAPFALTTSVLHQLPAAQRTVAQTGAPTGLVPACTALHRFSNQVMAILFYQLGDQSSSWLPQMARAFFDRVSKAAASPPETLLAQQLLFKCTNFFLRSGYQLRPAAWMGRQQSMLSKQPLSRPPVVPGYSRYSDNRSSVPLHSWARVWHATAAQFGTRHPAIRAGSLGWHNKNPLGSKTAFFQAYSVGFRNAGLPAQLGNTLIKRRHHLLDGLCS